MEGRVGFRASLRFLATEEGGRRRSCWSGYAPNLRLGNHLTAISLVKMDGDEVAGDSEMAPGGSYEVFVVVWFPDQNSPEDLIPPLVQIAEGPKLVAEGRVAGHTQAFTSAPPSVDDYLEGYAADQEGTLRKHGYR